MLSRPAERVERHLGEFQPAPDLGLKRASEIPSYACHIVDAGDESEDAA